MAVAATFSYLLTCEQAISGAVPIQLRNG